MLQNKWLWAGAVIILAVVLWQVGILSPSAPADVTAG
jgi:hypothetical protein